VKKDGARDTFAIKEVWAAKEHRITLGLDELPSEVCLYVWTVVPRCKTGLGC
jgi:hypothetical protein